MALANWTNKWILMLAAGILLQIVVYPYVWFFGVFEHSFFLEVFVIALASVVIQLAGFFVIMLKTHNTDPSYYHQGRPFRHKLREEDAGLATRKPTFDSA